MAALCGFAVVLNTPEVLAKIPSNSFVRLLFQPAEETPGGAVPMIKGGCLDDVDEVYGWHNWVTAPVGTMLLTAGTIMAHDADFYITISGLGGHGSAPDACVDPVPCAASVVLALQTVVSRTLHSSTNAVLSVTMFHAGEATNVIPDSAKLAGTIRDLDAATFSKITAAVDRIVAGTAAAFGCTGTVRYESGYAETRNHDESVEIVRSLAAKGPRQMDISAEGLPIMGTEDFSYYLQKKPGCFFLVGSVEARRTGLSALPFDGGQEWHESDERAAKKSKTEAAASAAASAASLSVPGAGWTNGEFKCRTGLCDDDSPGSCCARTNCCAHGTAYDFNDNALPYVVSMFLKITEHRLTVRSGLEPFLGSYEDDGVEAKIRS
jgi:amidohydrolase